MSEKRGREGKGERGGEGRIIKRREGENWRMEREGENR